MNDEDWEALDSFDDKQTIEISEHEQKNRGKVRKRKWREIDAIKEQRRLRRDMEQYEQYSY